MQIWLEPATLWKSAFKMEQEFIKNSFAFNWATIGNYSGSRQWAKAPMQVTFQSIAKYHELK